MGAKDILIVEDEAKIAEVIAAYLKKDGFNPLIVDKGREAVTLVGKQEPSLIVLDIMLPDISGREACALIRRVSDVPIIMVTALSSEDDKIEGLSIGADDYLTKPFSPRELVARVHSLLRRSGGGPRLRADTMTFDDGRLSIDITRHQVEVNGEEIDLTPLEFKLLTTLAHYPGRVYSRSELVSQVQGYDFVGYERTIDAHVKNLRQKIEADSKKPRYIKTVFGVGYKFAD